MDERAQILLKTLVEHYISDGHPLGSNALLQYSGLSLSSATIRNIMSELEVKGFVSSPHTSAGRIPTQQGYRFFVDSLLSVQPLESQQIKQLESTLKSSDHQALISTAADMLSNLTQFAGMILVPKRKAMVFKHLEFIPLSEKRILAVIVATDGSVQNRIILSENPYTSSELTKASNYFNTHYAGQTIDEARQKIHHDLKKMQADISKLMAAALNTNEQDKYKDGVIIAGERNLLNIDELTSNVAKLRKLFDAFEQRTSLMQLLDISQKADGVQIFIGGESGYSSLDECSMVTSPYEVDGQVVGTLGVIGPTRMAYERIIPIVDITAKLLSNALSNK
ncbi:MAG TPA: heat-inducible transcriptional repressor HrcA [Methylophilaceae bacterium]|nr:heat-inducible transcriptional repressor HrcA [Methylophilaceae bacterium]